MDDALKQLLQSQFGITFRSETIMGVAVDVPYDRNGQSLMGSGGDEAAIRESTTRNVLNDVFTQLEADMAAGDTQRIAAMLVLIGDRLPDTPERDAIVQRLDSLVLTVGDNPAAGAALVAFLRDNGPNLITHLQSPNDFGVSRFLDRIDTAVAAAGAAVDGEPDTGVDAPAGTEDTDVAAGPEATAMPFSRAAADIASQIVGEMTHMGLVNPPMVDGDTVDWAQSTCIYAYSMISPPESYNSRAGKTDFDVFFNSVLRADHQEILGELRGLVGNPRELYAAYAAAPSQEKRDELLARLDEAAAAAGGWPPYMQGLPAEIRIGMFFNGDYEQGLTGWYMCPEMVQMFIRHIDEGHPELYGPESSAAITGYRIEDGRLVPIGAASQMGPQFEAMLNLMDVRDGRRTDPVERVLEQTAGAMDMETVRSNVTGISDFNLGEALEQMFEWLFGGLQQARDDFGRGAG